MKQKGKKILFFSSTETAKSFSSSLIYCAVISRKEVVPFLLQNGEF